MALPLNSSLEDQARRQAILDKLEQRKNSAKKMIWVTFQRAGFHYYPAAASDPALADVMYLGNIHRHLFKFKVWIEIFHNDREIEFHQFLNFCESLFTSQHINIDYKSVEMLADEMYLSIASKYPHRDIWIEVSEDSENGCFNQYNKE